MMSLHVICGLGLPQSKILGTPMNWRSPKKIFLDLFFQKTLVPVFLVLSHGFEHFCSWLQEGLSSERLSLALGSDFFVSLASSLVSSTPPLVSNFLIVHIGNFILGSIPTNSKLRRLLE